MTGAALLGCGSPNQQPNDLTIIDVRADDDQTLVLTFSQPLGSVSDVDPNDFRISVGFTHRSTYSDGGGSITVEEGRYVDLGYYVSPDITRFEFTSAVLGNEDELVLTGAVAFVSSTCQQMVDYKAEFANYHDGEVELAMFLHYAAGDVPIESASGKLLADIAPDWVLDQGTVELLDGYGFPKLNPRIEIPCP